MKRKPMKRKQPTRNGLCECGCGQVTEVWAQTQRHRGRIKGERKRFVRGHNARRPGIDYDTPRFCADCGAPIGAIGRNKNGLCRPCFMREVGKLGVKLLPDCAYCGKRCPSSERKYCSRACYSIAHKVPEGEEHHSWRGDEVGYWGRYSRAQKKIPPGPCEECGDPRGCRHHKNRNTLDNSPENIAYLCASCHKKLHIREDGLFGACAR